MDPTQRPSESERTVDIWRESEGGRTIRWTVVEYAGVYPGEAEGRPGVETWQ